MKKIYWIAMLAILALPVSANGDVVLNGFGGIGSTNTGVNTVSDSTAVAETILDVEVILQGAVHDWVGDLQITLSNGSSEIIILGLQDGLTFNGTGSQAGNAGAGTFGSSAHFSGDPDDDPTPLDYTFATGGADFDAAATSSDGGLTMDSTVVYAPTAEDTSDADVGVVSSFADVFGGQSTAGTWTISVVDTFTLDADGSFAGFEVRLVTVPEPTSAWALIGLGGLVLARRRK